MLFFEVGVYVIDTEVHIQIELQSSCNLIAIPKFVSISEELISISSVKHNKECIFVWFVAVVGIDLRFGFEVGSL